MTKRRSEGSSSRSGAVRDKSLQDLDGEDWGDGSFFPSHVVLTVHRLRRVPLGDFTVEDLRIMIGQDNVNRASLGYLVPLAIERLRKNPFVAGDFYPGDLLCNVLRLKADFWQAHAELWRAIDEIVASVESLPSFPEEVGNYIEGILRTTIAEYRQANTR